MKRRLRSTGMSGSQMPASELDRAGILTMSNHRLIGVLFKPFQEKRVVVFVL